MTIEQLHDALNLLPSDLIAATDRRRAAPKAKTIPLRRWVSLAACVAVLLCAGFAVRQGLFTNFTATKEAATEAPAAMAPAMDSPAEEKSESQLADSAMPETILEEAPAAEEPEKKEIGAGSAATDHNHSFADGSASRDENAAYCGMTQITIHIDGTSHTLTGEQAIQVVKILDHLPYDAELVCRCMGEFTVDTETISGIDVNLTEGFARCGEGQASLTQSQVETLSEILQTLPE